MYKYLLIIFITFLFIVTPVRADENYCAEIKVMTYNVTRESLELPGMCSWSNGRKEIIANTIKAANPDIIAFQETDTGMIGDLSDLLPEYTFYPKGKASSPIAAKNSIVGSGPEVQLDEAKTRSFASHYIINPASPNRVSLDIYNYHFGSDPLDRLSDMMDLNYRLNYSSKNVIVLGDFNETIGEPRMNFLTGQGDLNGVSVVNPLQLVTNRTMPNTVNYSCTVPDNLGTGRPKIDHIFTSKNITKVSNQTLVPSVGETVGSDHWPVVATLRVGDCSPKPSPLPKPNAKNKTV